MSTPWSEVKVMKMKKKVVLPVVALVALILIGGGIVWRMKHGPTTVSALGAQAIPVQAVAVVMGDLSSINSLTGTVSANLTTGVGAQVGGLVKAVDVNMGQDVAAGEVLAQLATTNLQEQLAQDQAQVQVDQARVNGDQAAVTENEANFQRNQALLNSGAVSQSTFDTAKFQLQQSQAQLQADEGTLAKDRAAVAAVQQQIEEMTIVSPVSGVVASKNIEVGEEVSTSTVLFNIVQIDPVQVTVNVSSQLIAQIHPGTSAQITVPELGTKTFEGTVAHVSPVLDTASQGYPVQILVRNPEHDMLPGMTATVVFTGLHTTPGLIIPAQAVLETTQGSEVFTVQNGIAHLHLVQLGAVSSNEVVVVSGLTAGEQVVTNGVSLLSDGSRVRVVQSAAQAGVQGMINQLQAKAGKGAGK